MPMLAEGPGHALPAHSTCLQCVYTSTASTWSRAKRRNMELSAAANTHPGAYGHARLLLLTRSQGSFWSRPGDSMSMESRRPCKYVWTPHRICVAQTSEASNADNQNFTFPMRHQCSVQAGGESANVAKDLHQINMLC